MSVTATEFKGQIALVTGASRGIGAAIALELAKQGLLVVGTATTDEGAARISAALAAYAGCRGANLNVNDAGAGEALIDEIVKSQGGLHVLVNNAGITRDTLAMRMKDDDWDAVLDTNLKAVFRMSRAAIRPMMKQRYGRIISITSVVGASGNPGQANYAAAKAGVAGMTRALARELGSRNITVNCVAPGFIATDMTADGGGWTLLVTNQNTNGWTYENSILLNEFNPVISGSNYSIVTYGDYIKKPGASFQYMIDAYERNRFGGIWTAQQLYSFVYTANTQTSVIINTKFGTWNYNDSSIEQRMPWRSNSSGLLTTSENAGGEWWGTLITNGGWNPAPWIKREERY